MQKILEYYTRANSKISDLNLKYPVFNNGSKEKTNVLFAGCYFNGTGLYRTIVPAMALNTTSTHAAIIANIYPWSHEGFGPVTLDMHEELLKWADYIVLPTMISNSIELAKWMQDIKKTYPKIKFVMDVDDNIFELPSTDINYKFYKNETIRHNLISNIEMCDKMTSPNQALINYFSGFTRLLRKESDFYYYPNLIIPEMIPEERCYTPKENKIKIGMITNRAHYPQLYAFRKILQAISDIPNVELVNIGWTGNMFNKPNPFEHTGIKCFPPASIDNYFSEIIKHEFDLALIPIFEGVHPFYDYKSNQRFFEFTLCDVPVLIGNHSVYLDLFNNSYGPHIAEMDLSHPEEIIERIQWLAADSDCRKGILKTNQAVCENYNAFDEKHINILTNKIYTK